MRCYTVTAKDYNQTLATRYAGTNADARAVRDELQDKLKLRKKDVEIEQVDVPVGKNELLAYLNELAKKQDVQES